MSCELTVGDWIIVSHHLFTSVSSCCMNLDFLNMMVAKSFYGKEPSDLRLHRSTRSDLAVHCLKDLQALPGTRPGKVQWSIVQLHILYTSLSSA